MSGSEYVDEQRREYSLYVLQQRAIPAISDGLKTAHRRVMWIAKDGKKHKSATLAGATMPIHPHQAPEGAINTLAGPYGNNIPLLSGDGAFGTLLNPTAYGASRYTSVKISQFAKDVLYADLELVPLQENYDGTLEEPVHFLPLVPLALVNPSEGIAVGFASTILPRKLDEIIEDQIKHLQGKKVLPRAPHFAPTDNKGIKIDTDKEKWMFLGEFKRLNTTTINITKLPYGADHEKYIDFLMKLEEKGTIVDFEDNSKDVYDITIKFKRGFLAQKKDGDLYTLLKLGNSVSENMNVLDFDGQYVLGANYVQIIEDFTDWRLIWYVKRYKRLAKNLGIDIQRYKDVLRAIDKNVGMVARKTKSRSELKEFLKAIDIVHLDYIADLPVYRFTEDEAKKTEKKLKDAEELMAWYQKVLADPKERIKIYISELKNILKNYNKNMYNEED